MSDSESYENLDKSESSTENEAIEDDIKEGSDFEKLTAKFQKLTDKFEVLNGEFKNEFKNLINLNQQTHDKVQEYVASLKSDLECVGEMRRLAVFISFMYILIINLFMFCIMYYHKFFFFLFHSYTQAIFFFVIISSSTLLLAAFLRGTFKTYADRHKENRTLAELETIVKAVLSKGTDQV